MPCRSRGFALPYLTKLVIVRLVMDMHDRSGTTLASDVSRGQESNPGRGVYSAVVQSTPRPRLHHPILIKRTLSRFTMFLNFEALNL